MIVDFDKDFKLSTEEENNYWLVGKFTVSLEHKASGKVFSKSGERSERAVVVSLLKEEIIDYFKPYPDEYGTYDRYDWTIRYLEPKMVYGSKDWVWYKQECKRWIDGYDKRMDTGIPVKVIVEPVVEEVKTSGWIV